MKMKCTRITQTMSHDHRRDADGAAVKNEKGHAIYEYMPRWEITFEVVGERRKLSGHFHLNTTFAEQAAHYVLHGIYEFSDITHAA